MWVTVDQGGLYLTGTAADQGTFTCVPGFPRIIRDWLESLPPGAERANRTSPNSRNPSPDAPGT